MISTNEDTIGEVNGAELNFVCRPLPVRIMTLDVIIDSQKDFLTTKLLEAQENGSGWTLHSVYHLTLLLKLNTDNVSAIRMLFL